ncbi:hypothetical protein ACFVVX_25425 [Kitasatospora sp. NPDC058170]|uniref:hypothetical protein n=1 Tax=Kitasatospora sp. NPDC058170 TaxID=3346364 RepID=UPI0036D997F5
MSEQPGRTAPPTAGAGGFLARIAARAEGVSGPGRLRPRPVSRFERLREDGGAAPDGSPGGADPYPDPASPWSAPPVGAARQATDRFAPAGPSAGPRAGSPDRPGGAADAGSSVDPRPSRTTPARPGPAGSAGSAGSVRPAERAEQLSAAAWSGLAAAVGAASDEASAPAGPEQAPRTAEGRPAAGPAADRTDADGRADGADRAARDGLAGRDGPRPRPRSRSAPGRSEPPDRRPPSAAHSDEPLDGVGPTEWPMPQARRGRPSAPAPVVHVTIGRVEVRAVPAGPTGPERGRSEEPAVTTLDQYLRRRARDRG